MFAYGICVGATGKYETFAKPSLRKFAPGQPCIERGNQSSIFKAYNSILDEARNLDGLEGLVLLHDDVELLSPIDDILRAEFADESVAIVGAIGGRGLRSVRWSRASLTFGRAPDPINGENDHGRGHFDVDTVDGLLLALSPWAVGNLRFDVATFAGFHGYDADICMQARRMGKRVRVADLALFHHTKGGFGDGGNHRAADDAFRRKWDIPLDPVLHRLRRRLRGHVY